MRILLSVFLLLILSGCGEPDTQDLLKQLAKEEKERLANLTPEEREQEAATERQRLEEEEKAISEALEQEQWELKYTDLIHYRISRYSSDGKFVDEDRYVLTPVTSEDKLKMHKLKNRGFYEHLDTKSIVVDSAFLGEVPTGKFDIYAVIWNSMSRTINDKVRVELVYKDISRGW